jgi:hypothetical protein
LPWDNDSAVSFASPQVWNSDTTVVADRFQRRDKFLDILGDPMAEQRSCFKTEVWVQQSEIRASLLCCRVPTEPHFVAKVV